MSQFLVSSKKRKTPPRAHRKMPSGEENPSILANKKLMIVNGRYRSVGRVFSFLFISISTQHLQADMAQKKVLATVRYSAIYYDSCQRVHVFGMYVSKVRLKGMLPLCYLHSSPCHFFPLSTHPPHTTCFILKGNF